MGRRAASGSMFASNLRLSGSDFSDTLKNTIAQTVGRRNRRPRSLFGKFLICMSLLSFPPFKPKPA